MAEGGFEHGDEVFNITSSFIVLLTLIVISLLFGVLKRCGLRTVRKELHPILESLFSELTILGFISLLLFILEEVEVFHLLAKGNDVEGIVHSVHMALFFVSLLFLGYNLHLVLAATVLRDQWSSMDSLLLHYSPEAVAVAYAMVLMPKKSVEAATSKFKEEESTPPDAHSTLASDKDLEEVPQLGSISPVPLPRSSFRRASTSVNHHVFGAQRRCTRGVDEFHTAVNISLCWCCCSGRRFNGVTFTGGGCCRRKRVRSNQVTPFPSLVAASQDVLVTRVLFHEARKLIRDIKHVTGPFGSTRGFLRRLVQYASLKHSFIQVPIEHLTHGRVMLPRSLSSKKRLLAFVKEQSFSGIGSFNGSIAFNIEGEISATVNDFSPREATVSGSNLSPRLPWRKSFAWPSNDPASAEPGAIDAGMLETKRDSNEADGDARTPIRGTVADGASEVASPNSYLSPTAGPLLSTLAQKPEKDDEWTYVYGYDKDIYARAFVKRQHQELRWKAPPVVLSSTPWVVADEDSPAKKAAPEEQDCTSNGYQLHLPWDFELSNYLMTAIGEDMEEVVETTPLTWVVILVAVAIMEPLVFEAGNLPIPLSGIGCAVLSISLAVFSYIVYRKLGTILKHVSSQGLGVAVEEAKSRLSTKDSMRGLEIRWMPPYVSKLNPKVVRKCSRLLGQYWQPHEQLMWGGPKGKACLQFAFRILLFGAAVLLSALFLLIHSWRQQYEAHVIAVFAVLGLCPVLLSVVMAPLIVEHFVIALNVGQFRKTKLISTILFRQRTKKSLTALQLLVSLKARCPPQAASPKNGVKFEGTLPTPRNKKVALERERRAHQVFQAFDADKDGAITRKEIKAVIQAVADEGIYEDLNMDNMMSTMDKNKDERISWEEFRERFLTLLDPFTEEDTNNVVDWIFQQVDQDKSGKLSLEELYAFLQGVTPGDVFLGDVAELLVECDTDDDGLIDKAELHSFLARNLHE